VWVGAGVGAGVCAGVCAGVWSMGGVECIEGVGVYGVSGRESVHPKSTRKNQEFTIGFSVASSSMHVPLHGPRGLKRKRGGERIRKSERKVTFLERVSSMASNISLWCAKIRNLRSGFSAATSRM
jgi:hypothetical protein